MIKPSKHLLVFKTSWGRLQNMSWRRLQNVFSVTVFRLQRHLEDVLQRRLKDISQDVLKKSWKTKKNCYAEDVLKTCLEDFLKTCLQTTWRHVLKTSSRRLGDKNKWGYLYLTNLNVCVSNKSIFQKSISDESKANPKSLVRTQ